MQYPKDTTKDKDGNYFYDRNGDLFNYVLDFYRTGKIVYPTTISQEDFNAELDFWNIPVKVSSPKLQLRDIIDMDLLYISISKHQYNILRYGDHATRSLPILGVLHELIDLINSYCRHKKTHIVLKHFRAKHLEVFAETVDSFNSMMYKGELVLTTIATNQNFAKDNDSRCYQEDGIYYYRRVDFKPK